MLNNTINVSEWRKKLISSDAQTHITLFPWDLMLFSEMHRHQACMFYTDIHAHKTHTYKIKSSEKKNINHGVLLIYCKAG